MTKRSGSVAHAVRRAGGVARTNLLARQGFSSHDIADAVAAGLLRRERRVWVAVPDADAQLVFAARAGVVLSCITLARRLGLWVLDPSVVHVACDPHASKIRAAGAVVHRHIPLIARPPGVLIDGVVNMLQAVAACQPYESALAVWDSALNRRLIDHEQLVRLPFRGRARELAAQASPFRDSGLESFVVPRLRWLKLPIRSQTWLFGHRVDFLIGARLVLQIDGGHHVDAQRAADVAHDVELMLRGYHVIRVTYDQVVNHWPDVQERILRAIAQGLHRAA
jgi:very-short-patch-repair endonuclease